MPGLETEAAQEAPQVRGSASLATVVERNDEMLYTEVDDSIVMMDVGNGQYCELDSVGARVWALIETGRPVAEVCDALVAEYDVEPDVCRCDVLAFIEEIAGLGIVRARPAASAASPGPPDGA